MEIKDLKKTQLSWEEKLKELEACAIISDDKFSNLSVRFKKLHPFLETANINQIRELHHILTELLNYLDKKS